MHFFELLFILWKQNVIVNLDKNLRNQVALPIFCPVLQEDISSDDSLFAT